MPKNSKYLYCPNCKCYPNNIYDKDICWTTRKWDGDCYQGQDQEYENNPISFCSECDTQLIEK